MEEGRSGEIGVEKGKVIGRENMRERGEKAEGLCRLR